MKKTLKKIFLCISLAIVILMFFSLSSNMISNGSSNSSSTKQTEQSGDDPEIVEPEILYIHVNGFVEDLEYTEGMTWAEFIAKNPVVQNHEFYINENGNVQSRWLENNNVYNLWYSDGPYDLHVRDVDQISNLRYHIEKDGWL